jgi:hypothetical protein
MVFAVRIFTPVKADSKADVAAAKHRLRTFAEKLLLRDFKP